jgi:hypothetical protein
MHETYGRSNKMVRNHKKTELKYLCQQIQNSHDWSLTFLIMQHRVCRIIKSCKCPESPNILHGMKSAWHITLAMLQREICLSDAWQSGNFLSVTLQHHKPELCFFHAVRSTVQQLQTQLEDVDLVPWDVVMSALVICGCEWAVLQAKYSRYYLRKVVACPTLTFSTWKWYTEQSHSKGKKSSHSVCYDMTDSC